MHVIGLGSNLLVRDGGVPGIVIRLGRGFGEIKVEHGQQARAPARRCPTSRSRARRPKPAFAGLAFYRGIPGSIGGALRMNAGAHGRETKDCLVGARAVDRARQHSCRCRLPTWASRIAIASVPEDWIFTEATYQGTPGEPAEILKEMDEVADYREKNQPIKERTGGSTFQAIRRATAPGSSSTRPAAGACASAAPRFPRCTAIF